MRSSALPMLHKFSLSLLIVLSPLFAQDAPQKTTEPARRMGIAKPLELTERFETYGSPLKERPAVPLGTLLAHPKTYEGAVVELRGTIEEVCQVKGCWVILRDGPHRIRVRFKDYAFFMPLDGTDRYATMQGEVVSKVLTQDERRHYAEDAGKPKDEIEKIVGDELELSLLSDAVRLGLPVAHEPKPGLSKSLGKTAAGDTLFGDLHSGKTKVVALPELLANPKSFLDQNIRIQGFAAEICAVKGCWMMVQHKDTKIRVQFKDYGFFMPLDGAGRFVDAEGQVQVKVETEAERRHYAEDAGKSKEEIEAIKGDAIVVSFLAKAVLMGPAAR